MFPLIGYFKEAGKLDIFGLNFIYANEKAGTLYLPSATLNKKGKLIRFLFFGAKFFKEALNYKNHQFSKKKNEI